MFLKKRIILNARGVKFEILAQKFNNFPDNSRLGKLKNYSSLDHANILTICDEFYSETMYDEFYFDRDPDILRLILNFYSTRKFHCATQYCALYLEEEMDYWRMDVNSMELCCRLRLDACREQIVEDIRFEKEIIDIYNKNNEFSDVKYFPKTREWLWGVMEKPNSSKVALVIDFSIFILKKLIFQQNVYNTFEIMINLIL